ncbi:MAG: helix-turn-helix transcriptional regulator [Bacteriovoracia bacterium]
MSTKRKSNKKTLDSILEETPSFGETLAAIRKSDEVTQADLARCVKVSRGLICDIEKGRRDASLKQVARFAKILGYPPEVFLSIYLEEQMKKANLNFKVTLDEVA